MKNHLTILVAHIDKPGSSHVGDALAYAGYNPVPVPSINEAQIKMLSKRTDILPDLILLCNFGTGVVKPRLIRGLRKAFSAPILLLADNPTEKDAVEALDAGAYDVLRGTFGTDEHFARIRASIRNASVRGNMDTVFKMGNLTINFATRAINADGRTVNLTPIEFRILTLLARNNGRVLTYEQIINDIWGPYNSDNLVLRVNMANIRKKIEVNPSKPKYVITEMGVGYKMARAMDVVLE